MTFCIRYLLPAVNCRYGDETFNNTKPKKTPPTYQHRHIRSNQYQTPAPTYQQQQSNINDNKTPAPTYQEKQRQNQRQHRPKKNKTDYDKINTSTKKKKPLIPTYQQQPYHHRHIKSNNDRIKDTGIDISRETTIGSTTKLDKEEHLRRQRQDPQ